MLTKISSINTLIKETAAVVRRFPWTVLAAVSATITAQLSFNYPGEWLACLIAVCILGIIVFLAVEIAFERYSSGYRVQTVSLLSVFLLLYLFYFSHTLSGQTVFWIRCGQLLAASVAALIVVPFVRTGTARQCWWNTAFLFEGTVVAWFTAVVVYLGLVAGISLFKYLFGVTIASMIYMRIWILCSLLLAPWILMTFVPKPTTDVSESVPYPQRLETLLRYVFIPLTFAYILLLYAYIVKIGIIREWPKGTLGYLIAGVSTLGVLAWLALYPIKDDVAGHPNRFAKYFFPALFPLLALLLLAVWRRTDEYGITERRFFLGLYGVWMCGLATYYTFSKRKNPRWIPATLAVLSLATTAGPWSAYAVSARSQAARLKDAFVEHGWLKNGKIVQAEKKPLPPAEYRSIMSAVEYLATRNETDRIQPWIEETLKGKNQQDLRKALGLEFIQTEETKFSYRRFTIFRNNFAANFIKVGGYDYAWKFETPTKATVQLWNTPVELAARLSGQHLEIVFKGTALRFNLKHLTQLASDKTSYMAPDKTMEMETTVGEVKFKLILDSMSGEITNDGIHIRNLYGVLLIKK